MYCSNLYNVTIDKQLLFSVNVRDAVAVMEARINSTPTERITKVTRSNPVKVTSGANDLAAPKEEHARSMSDSSDSQISFKQMKEMWNQKAVERKLMHEFYLFRCSSESIGFA